MDSSKQGFLNWQLRRAVAEKALSIAQEEVETALHKFIGHTYCENRYSNTSPKVMEAIATIVSLALGELDKVKQSLCFGTLKDELRIDEYGRRLPKDDSDENE